MQRKEGKEKSLNKYLGRNSLSLSTSAVLSFFLTYSILRLYSLYISRRVEEKVRMCGLMALLLFSCVHPKPVQASSMGCEREEMLSHHSSPLASRRRRRQKGKQLIYLLRMREIQAQYCPCADTQFLFCFSHSLLLQHSRAA